MRIIREKQGQAIALRAVVIALVCLGMAGLAVDVGMLYHNKRVVQAAADAGALAAAAGESSGTSITQAAYTAATQNGLDVATGTPAPGQSTVSAVDGIVGTANTSYVQVTVTEQSPTFFIGAFSPTFGVIPVAGVAQASYLSPNATARR
jgi:uncharacterized membrane protein